MKINNLDNLNLVIQILSEIFGFDSHYNNNGKYKNIEY